MLLERVILPSKAVTGRRLVVHYVSRHIIFHDLIPTNKSKGKGILRHKRRAQGSCLNSCVAWAITLTERRSARFAFSGMPMPFPSITRNPTGGATVEHLPLINCSSWACTQDFDALREVRERRWKIFRLRIPCCSKLSSSFIRPSITYASPALVEQPGTFPWSPTGPPCPASCNQVLYPSR